MHHDETNFLEAIAKNRSDDAARLIYADWLEERGDIRAEYLHFQLATKYLSVDHACSPTIESSLIELIALGFRRNTGNASHCSAFAKRHTVCAELKRVPEF